MSPKVFQSVVENSEPLYELDKAGWKGMDVYRCLHSVEGIKNSRCRFSTFSEEVMREHVASHLVPAPRRRPLEVPLFDDRGNPITHIESEE